MEYIYAYLEEKSEECQFSLDELLAQIEGEYRPDFRTLKGRLFEKYGEDIVIAETSNKKCIVCFRNLGHKILTNAWYENKETDPQAEKLRVVKEAANIILGDIRSKIFDVSEYTPPDNFLIDVESVIPESVLLFFQTIIFKNKRSDLDKWQKKCIALSHALMSAVRPRSFLSSLLNSVSVYLYHKFGSKQLIELLSSLGFASSYNDASMLEISAVMRPEKIAIDEGFLQFVFDNADFNVNTLNGLNTFHAMGGIMVVTPQVAITPDTNLPKVNKCTSSQLVEKCGQIKLEMYHKRENCGLKTVEILDVEPTDSIQNVTSSQPPHLLWLYGKTSTNINLPGWNGLMETATTDNTYERSKVVCLPFINNPPSQYDTILTAILMAMEKCVKYNMKTCFVTFDQPLYIKAQEITSNNIDFKNVVVRLGGFHLLMSFMGAVGVIMSGSGLKELFTLIYAENSVEKIMSGHAYARALRAHSLAHLALAKLIMKTISFSEEQKVTMESMLENLDLADVAENSVIEALVTKFSEAKQEIKNRGPTSELWINYFHMITLVKQFIDAERAGNWNLHLNTIRQMLPFFHAAGHFFMLNALICIIKT